MASLLMSTNTWKKLILYKSKIPRVRWTRLWKDGTIAVVIDVTRGVDVVLVNQGLRLKK